MKIKQQYRNLLLVISPSFNFIYGMEKENQKITEEAERMVEDETNIRTISDILKIYKEAAIIVEGAGETNISKISDILSGLLKDKKDIEADIKNIYSNLNHNSGTNYENHLALANLLNNQNNKNWESIKNIEQKLQESDLKDESTNKFTTFNQNPSIENDFEKLAVSISTHETEKDNKEIIEEVEEIIEANTRNIEEYRNKLFFLGEGSDVYRIFFVKDREELLNSVTELSNKEYSDLLKEYKSRKKPFDKESCETLLHNVKKIQKDLIKNIQDTEEQCIFLKDENEKYKEDLKTLGYESKLHKKFTFENKDKE